MGFILANYILWSPLLFLWGLCVTPISIGLANRYKILDYPERRKIHTMVTPRGAGIVLWLGFLLWCLFAVEAIPILPVLALGATLVFFSGYWDDMRPLNPTTRFLTHIVSASLVTYFVPMPLAHALVCFVWITGMTSAYNLIDGANGLCLFMFISTSSLLSLMGKAFLFIPMAFLAAGILPWNFPRAKTFLGDGGTTLLGYLLSSLFTYAIAPQMPDIPLIALPFLLLLIGGIPVWDTLFAIVRRLWSGFSPFHPDRGHFHHRLMDNGLSPFLTVILLTGLQIAVVGLGVFLFTPYVP